jgi:hypothetical protein
LRAGCACHFEQEIVMPILGGTGSMVRLIASERCAADRRRAPEELESYCTLHAAR